MPGTRKFGGQLCSLTPNCKRKQRYRDGGCDPCHWRTINEGTAKKPPPTAVYLERVKLVNSYNRLIRRGMKPHEIATMWGLDRKKLASKIYRAKRYSGLKVINGSTVRWNKLKPETPSIKAIRPKVSDHGEGRRGKKGCNDECCMAVRRQTWRENNKLYRERLKCRKAERQAAMQPDEMP